MVRRCKNGGLTERAWCKENGLNEKTYYHRQKRVCDALPVKVNRTAQFAEVSPASVKPPAGTGIQIRIGAAEIRVDGNSDLAYADAKKPELEMTEVKAHYRKKAAESKERLPENLPVEIVEHPIPEEERICLQCGKVLRVIGKTERDTLVIVPATATARRDVCYTYACEHCEKCGCSTPILKAEAPTPLIKGNIASPETVAHIMVQKFVMASPLYRQEQEWERRGIPLSRQTMSNWLLKCTEDYLVPEYEILKQQLVQHDVLHADETMLQVLHEEGQKPQSKSYMWLYRTSGDATSQIILYEYQPDRKAEHPKSFLKDFYGYLHADGYLSTTTRMRFS